MFSRDPDYIMKAKNWNVGYRMWTESPHLSCVLTRDSKWLPKGRENMGGSHCGPRGRQKPKHDLIALPCTWSSLLAREAQGLPRIIELSGCGASARRSCQGRAQLCGCNFGVRQFNSYFHPLRPWDLRKISSTFWALVLIAVKCKD